MLVQRVQRVRRGMLGIAGAIVLALSLAVGTSVGATDLPDQAFTNVGCDVGNYTCYYARVGTPYYGYGSAYNGYAYGGYAPVGVYQYQDNRFCDDGQINATPQGFFCTTSGVPAYPSGGVAFAPGAFGGYPAYGYTGYYVAPSFTSSGIISTPIRIDK